MDDEEVKLLLDIQKTILSNPVNMNGWIVEGGKPDFSIDTLESYKNIACAIKEIPNILIKAKRASKFTSYGAKHILERYRNDNSSSDIYISNGEFIVAMLMLGFEYKKPDHNNLIFKCKDIYKHTTLGMIGV